MPFYCLSNVSTYTKVFGGSLTGEHVVDMLLLLDAVQQNCEIFTRCLIQDLGGKEPFSAQSLFINDTWQVDPLKATLMPDAFSLQIRRRNVEKVPSMVAVLLAPEVLFTQLQALRTISDAHKHKLYRGLGMCLYRGLRRSWDSYYFNMRHGIRAIDVMSIEIDHLSLLNFSNQRVLHGTRNRYQETGRNLSPEGRKLINSAFIKGIWSR